MVETHTHTNQFYHSPPFPAFSIHQLIRDQELVQYLATGGRNEWRMWVITESLRAPTRPILLGKSEQEV